MKHKTLKTFAKGEEKQMIIRVEISKWKKFRSLAYQKETSMNILINKAIDKMLSNAK